MCLIWDKVAADRPICNESNAMREIKKSCARKKPQRAMSFPISSLVVTSKDHFHTLPLQ